MLKLERAGKISEGFANSWNSFHIMIHEGHVKVMTEYFNQRLCGIWVQLHLYGGDISVFPCTLQGMCFICCV